MLSGQTHPYSRKISWIFLLPAFLLGAMVVLSLKDQQMALPFMNVHGKVETTDNGSACGLTVARINGYQFVKPLLSVEQGCESHLFADLKSDLAGLTDSLKKAGAIQEASVYFRQFKQGEWFELNGDEKYHPASLMKVALLLAYLRTAESSPALFDQKILYTKPDSVKIPADYFPAPTIQQGKEYTIHDLLYFMAAHSDNNATWLLASRLNGSLTNKVFSDLGLPVPTANNLEYKMSARECSVLFKAIYNSTCLSPEYSEYAAELLSNCSFQEGFAKGFPKNTKMWHKFGEWIRPGTGLDCELHESGIFYADNTPYLLTVMTRGKDTNQLASAIQAICRTTYKRVSAL